MTDLYEELYLSKSLDLSEIQRILAKQRNDWTNRSVAMPDEASRMLAFIDAADAAFATEESRAAYNEELASSQTPVVEPDRDAERKANYERFCTTAKEYFDTHEYDLAEVAINNALKNAPTDGADLKLCLLAAKTFFKLKKYDQSLNYLNQAIVLDSNNPVLYVEKYVTAYHLGQSTPDDQRGTTESLINILRIAITKAEKAGNNQSLAQACSYLAKLLFTRTRNSQTTEEARELAARAVGIDKSLEGANYVLNTLEQERIVEEKRKRKAEEERRKQEEAERKRKAEEEAERWSQPLMIAKDSARNIGLFISRDIVTRMPYHKPDGNITWEGCTLRKWLNTEFYDGLPDSIKSRVVEATNQNPDNPQYKTPGGNPTKDRVFLLSIDEAKKYLSDNSAGAAKYNGAVTWWWLRSPGDDAYLAAYVYGRGCVSLRGNYVGSRVLFDDGGVRPALWLNL
jgi:tetratricopeptide (TPR) repeat protein